MIFFRKSVLPNRNRETEIVNSVYPFKVASHATRKYKFLGDKKSRKVLSYPSKMFSTLCRLEYSFLKIH